MNNKIYYLLLLTIIAGLVLSGCGSSNQEMTTMSVEDSVESFFPFDQTLLESDYSRGKIENYLLTINPEVNVHENHYAIGDLKGMIYLK
jgi:endoglucanase Acf2